MSKIRVFLVTLLFIQCLVASPARSQDVDPAIIGAWYRDQRDAVGTVNRTVFEFSPDGRYTLHNASSGHSGRFQARDSRWSQQAHTTRWEDAGTYAFPQKDVLRITGTFGPSEWRRLADPPYFDSDEINGQPIPKYLPLIIMQNLIEVARPWRADAVPVMVVIERWRHGEFQVHIRYVSPRQRSGLSVMLFKHERRIHEYAAVSWNPSPMPPHFVDLPKVVEIAAREGRPPPYKRFNFSIDDQKRWGWGIVGLTDLPFNFFSITPSGSVDRSTEPSEYIKWYNEQWDRTINMWRQLFGLGRGAACNPNTDKNKCQWGHAYWRTICERSGPGTGVGFYDPGTMTCR